MNTTNEVVYILIGLVSIEGEFHFRILSLMDASQCPYICWIVTNESQWLTLTFPIIQVWNPLLVFTILWKHKFDFKMSQISHNCFTNGSTVHNVMFYHLSFHVWYPLNLDFQALNIVCPLLAKISSWHLQRIDLTKFCTFAMGIWFHSCTSARHSCATVFMGGWRAFMRNWRWSQRFSRGFRSGDNAGHSMLAMPLACL